MKKIIDLTFSTVFCLIKKLYAIIVYDWGKCMKDDFILQRKTDIGLIRDKNEDSALVATHPKDKNIKLLAIADGMGGKDFGDIASNYIISHLDKWFEKADLELLNNSLKVSVELKEIINKLNLDLIKKYGENKLGTTLTLALINSIETIILNIGDSRCYIYSDDELTQVTEDDSQVWLYYKSGEVSKEDLRYFSTSNFISACIGLNKDLCHSNIVTIDNDSYELILLVTDGVTDILTDKKIKELISKNKDKEILDRIIQEAVYVDQQLHVPLKLRREFKEPFYVPCHGKDNASGAIFIKNN